MGLALLLITTVILAACVAGPGDSVGPTPAGTIEPTTEPTFGEPTAEFTADPTAAPTAIPSPSRAEPSPTDSLTPTPTAVATILATTPPAPAWAADLDRGLACRQPSADVGGSVNGQGMASFAGTTAADVVRLFLESDAQFYYGIPLGTYEPIDTTDGWVLFGYVVEGRTVAAMSVTSTGSERPWGLWDIAACDPSEFDPATPIAGDINVWTVNGHRVPTTTLLERPDCPPDTMLPLDGRLYLRHPTGGPAGNQLTTYAARIPLPSTARGTHYRDGTRYLWTTPDNHAIYIGPAAGPVERWPRIQGDEIIHIDCN